MFSIYMCSQGHQQGARVQPQYHGQVMSQAYFLSFRSGPHNFDPTAVAEFWKNVWSYQVKIFFEKTKSTTPCVISSSAGAGSGEFHLYRKMRRKEQEREEVRNMKFFQVEMLFHLSISKSIQINRHLTSTSHSASAMPRELPSSSARAAFHDIDP